MAQTTVVLTHSRASDYQTANGLKARDVLNRLINLLSGASTGAYAATSVSVGQTAASGTLTLATASGTVGGSINGVSITVAYDTSDTITAAALAAAINASSNALVAGVVSASSALGVVTITSLIPGKAGNCVTLAASGTGVTASGARLTGGSSTTYTL